MTSAETAAPHGHGREAEIRASVAAWIEAVQSKDIGRIMARYAPDVVAYDAIAALRFEGSEAYGRHWEACMNMCPGPMTFELHDLHVTATDEIAFAHALNQCGGTDQNGETHKSWMRMTTCYRRLGGTWKIVHEHFSAPFDPENGKAMFDLTP